MKVWLVFKSYPTLAAVNDDLDVVSADVREVVAVCGTEEKAEALRAEFQALSDSDVEQFDCDPVEYSVSEWDVE